MRLSRLTWPEISVAEGSVKKTWVPDVPNSTTWTMSLTHVTVGGVVSTTNVKQIK